MQVFSIDLEENNYLLRSFKLNYLLGLKRLPNRNYLIALVPTMMMTCKLQLLIQSPTYGNVIYLHITLFM